MEVIADIQERFDVARWEVDGVRVWPFLRIQIGHALEQQNLAFGKTSFRSVSERLKRIAKAVLHIRRNNRCTERGAAAIFNDGSGYYSNAFGVAANKHYDNIRNALEHLNIKPVQIYDYAEPAIGKLLGVNQLEAALDGQVVSARVRDFLTIRRQPFPAELTGFEEFAAHCREREIDLDILNSRTLCAYVRSWVATRNYMIEALPRLHPNSLCFVTTYYGYYGMAYTSAMKALGHVVVDIQHGLQGSSHYAYAKWQPDANILCDQLPQAYLVWTQNDARNIQQWAKKGCAHVIAPPVPTIEFAPIRMADGRLIPDNCLVVLYSCSLLDIEKKAGLLRQLAQQRIDDAYFLVRCHPTEAKNIEIVDNYLKSINFINYEIRESSSAPLANQISRADVHISVSSSVAIECNAMNVPSILMREYAFSVLDEYNIGLFHYADDGKCAAETLKAIKVRSATRSSLQSNGQSIDDVVQAISKLTASAHMLQTT